MTEDTRPPDEITGKILGQFEMQEEIGRGGMASVYRARQQSMGRTVAVKVLPRNLMHDPTFYERFEREVEVISELEHPHILPIYDYGQSDGIPYIAMRYLGGGSLEHRLARGVINPDELDKPLRQISQALDYAHQRGIIHRDLKPGNIMLDEGGNAYLSDFGIARVMGSNLTGSMIVGTPAYMSPEQASGDHVDGRSDIYSLGVMLFHLLTGQRPFQAETPMAVLLKHLNEPMPALSDFRPGLPDSVNDVISKATAKDRDDRYSSAAEMALAFSEALRGISTQMDKPTQPMGATPIAVTGPDVVLTPSGLLSQDAITDATLTRSRGPSMGMILVLLVVVVAIVGGGIVLMTMNQDDNPEGPAVVEVMPTPFPRASTIVQDLYTVSIPDEWIPPQEFLDQSEGGTVRHAWRADDGSAYVSLTLLDAELTGDTAFFRDAVNQYESDHYTFRLPIMELIDEATAEDGTIRRSYWLSPLVDPEDRPLLAQRLASTGSGQLDVYFLQRSPYLVVMEMYTSDSSANILVLRMQSILDSLRIKTS